MDTQEGTYNHRLCKNAGHSEQLRSEPVDARVRALAAAGIESGPRPLSMEEGMTPEVEKQLRERLTPLFPILTAYARQSTATAKMEIDDIVSMVDRIVALPEFNAGVEAAAKITDLIRTLKREA